MKQYLDLMRHVREHGVRKGDRTGTGTLSVFGYQMRFDLGEGFPVATTKSIHMRSVIHELLWFLKGSTNIAYLHANDVTIWDEWADANMATWGRSTAAQWRSWSDRRPAAPIDQLAQVDRRASDENPESRRHIVSAWNVAEVLDHMKPCRPAIMVCSSSACWTRGSSRASLYHEKLRIVFLGLPFNIASYALLTMMVARVTGLDPGEFVHTLGDAHLYLNHLGQTDTQLAREPYPLPRMELAPGVESILDFTADDFTLVGYRHHPVIRAPVAV